MKKSYYIFIECNKEFYVIRLKNYELEVYFRCRVYDSIYGKYVNELYLGKCKGIFIFEKCGNKYLEGLEFLFIIFIIVKV